MKKIDTRTTDDSSSLSNAPTRSGTRRIPHFLTGRAFDQCVISVLTAGFLVVAALGSWELEGAPPLTSSDFGALDQAVNDGGSVVLAFDGDVLFAKELVVEVDTILEATGHAVRFDGNGAVRHFVVTRGTTLRLVNISLINGRVPDTSKVGIGLSVQSLTNDLLRMLLIGPVETRVGLESSPDLVSWSPLPLSPVTLSTGRDVVEVPRPSTTLFYRAAPPP